MFQKLQIRLAVVIRWPIVDKQGASIRTCFVAEQTESPTTPRPAPSTHHGFVLMREWARMFKKPSILHSATCTSANLEANPFILILRAREIPHDQNLDNSKRASIQKDRTLPDVFT